MGLDFVICDMSGKGVGARSMAERQLFPIPLLIGPNPDGIGVYRGSAKLSIFIETLDRSALILERQAGNHIANAV